MCVCVCVCVCVKWITELTLAQDKYPTFLLLHFFVLSSFSFIFYFYFILFFLFLIVLGLRCCTRSFSSYGERGLLFFAERELIAVASLVAEHGL